MVVAHSEFMMTKTWHLMILEPRPSMNQRRVVFQAASYAEAVEFARAEWRKVRRSVTLHSGEYDTYYWHRIDSNGVAEDRNRNSGVPAMSQVTADGCCERFASEGQHHVECNRWDGHNG